MKTVFTAMHNLLILDGEAPICEAKLREKDLPNLKIDFARGY